MVDQMVDRFFKFGFMHTNYDTESNFVAKTLIDIVYDVLSRFLSKTTKTNQKNWHDLCFCSIASLLKQYVRK